MKITFPHMGNMYICVKAFLDDFKVDYLIPPSNNKKSLEIGSKYTPELACLPLKYNIGNYIEAYKQGADTILMAGGCGPCRFGYYCEMHREILRDIGYEMDIITLEPPGKNILGLIKNVKRLTKGASLSKSLIGFAKMSIIAKKVDNLDVLVNKIRPIEIEKGSTNRIYKLFNQKVMNTKGSRKIKELINETEKQLQNVRIDSHVNPLRVGIVGEIYTSIDPYTNFFIESKLGNMGVEVHRNVTVSEWIIEHIIKKALHLPRDKRFEEAAKPYLGAMIGGHARETIGNTVLYAKDGFDGIIQVYPLTCMPEIVAESILPAIEKDLDIPILTLIIDEMTGEAGYLTRIEAFVDLLNKRRERVADGEGIAVFGD